MMKRLPFGKGKAKGTSMAKRDQKTGSDSGADTSAHGTAMTKPTETSDSTLPTGESKTSSKIESFNERKSRSTASSDSVKTKISKASTKNESVYDDKSLASSPVSVKSNIMSKTSTRNESVNDDKSFGSSPESVKSKMSKTSNNESVNDVKSLASTPESVKSIMSKTKNESVNDDKSLASSPESVKSKMSKTSYNESVNSDVQSLASSPVRTKMTKISTKIESVSDDKSLSSDPVSIESNADKTLEVTADKTVPLIVIQLPADSPSPIEQNANNSVPSVPTKATVPPPNTINEPRQIVTFAEKKAKPVEAPQSEPVLLKPLVNYINDDVAKSNDPVVKVKVKSRRSPEKDLTNFESIGKYYEGHDDVVGSSEEETEESDLPYKMTNQGLLRRKTAKARMYKDQDMETEYDEKMDFSSKRRQSIPCYYLTVLFGYLFFLGYMTSLIDDAMPKVITAEEAGTTRFSEERAWRYLREVVGEGPRVAGTRYHLEKTADLKLMLDEVASAATLPVHVDWQTVSGDYWLDYKLPFCNCYRNATNIIALLEGESGLNPDGTTNSSILFNCHYDSRPTSPGASDNALFCAAMVEVLQILSKSDTKLAHNIVFLFNGAEEFPLMGSPGFLKHPWSRGVTALVNLDSAGINCKSMLFQVSDARVVAAYSRAAPAPSAQSFGEVLFQSGLVPSDTDFRIFRDLADIHGVDIAFSKQGHVYHTRHDALAQLRGGVLQHSGDMLLAVAAELASDPALDHKNKEQTTAVYWDYLNLFMLTYPAEVALWLDLMVILTTVASVLAYLGYVGFKRSSVTELCWSAAGRGAAAAAGTVAVLVLTSLSVATTVQLRYLSNGWMVVPLYWLPFLTAAVGASQTFDAWRCTKSGLTRSRRSAAAAAASRACAAAALGTMMTLHLPPSARYVLSAPLLMTSLCALVALLAAKRRWLNSWQLLVLNVILATPALMFTLVIALKINTLMLPIMGRSISGTPDYLVAGLNVACVLLTALPLSGLELFFSRIKLWTVLLTFSLVCLVIAFVPLSPYQDSKTFPALQRHNWFHTEIYTYSQSGALVANTSGVWFGKTEVNTPHNVAALAARNNYVLRNVVKNFGDCKRYTYCNMPMVTPRTIDFFEGSLWTEFPPPRPAHPPPRLSLAGVVTEQNIRTYTFTINGPHHLAVVLSPRAGVTLRAWSLSCSLAASARWEGARQVYFVHVGRIAYTDEPADVTLSFSFHVPDPTSPDPVVDVSLHAHRTGHPEEFTAEYQALVEAMPDYFNIESYLSSRHNYVF